MATILFEGTEFNIGADLPAGRVLGAACIRYGDPGDWDRFRLFDENGRELETAEVVGERRLVLCDVRKLTAKRSRNHDGELRLTAGAK